MEKTFNPRPGDKIICKNGKEFICCTKEFLETDNLALFISNNYIFGYKESTDKEFHKYDWQYWNYDGSVSSDQNYAIREVIYQNTTKDKEQKEIMYSIEDIEQAFKQLRWMSISFNTLKDKLESLQSEEYKEYLRLKAIYG